MNKIESVNYVIDGVYTIFLRTRDKFAKAAQYLALLICYYFEREDRERAQQHFIIYKKIFTCRRIYRIGKSINYLTGFKQGIYELKKELSALSIFRLVTNVSRYAFYLCDNIAVCMQLIQSRGYHLMRRVSFSVLLISLLASILHNLVRLANTFKQENSLKKSIAGELTPKKFLIKLTEIDSERMAITYELVSRIGDLLPTLERMNLPQVLLKTRINKLTVGFFGLVGAISEIISINRVYTF